MTQKYSLLTFNTQHSNGLKDAADFNTDVIFFQEVYQDRVDGLTQTMKNHGYSFAGFAPSLQIKKTCRQLGQATYFKDKQFTLVKSESLPLGSSKVEAAIFGVRGQRQALKTILKDKGSNQLLTFINVHLVLLAPTSQRIKQMQKIVSYLDSQDQQVVIAGDFNQTKLLPIISGFKKFDLEMQKLGLKGDKSPVNTHTYWISLGGKTRFVIFQHRLDHIYAKGYNQVQSRVRDDVKSSDHLPVIATLS